MTKYRGEVGLLIVTIVWGFGFPLTNIALRHCTPSQILFIRFAIAAVLLSIVFHKKFKEINKLNIIAGVCVGACLYFGYIMQTVGMIYTTASKAAFLTTTNVVMVPIIAFIVCKQKLDKFSVFGAIIAFLGTAVLSFNMDFSINIGDVLSLGGAFGFALHIYYNGHFLQKGADAVLLTILQMATVAVLSLISYFLTENSGFTNIGNEGIITLFILGAVNTTITFLLQTVSQKYITNQTKAVVILSMESIFGTMASIILIKETLTPRMFIGCVIILTGVLFAELGAQFFKKIKPNAL